MLKPISLILLSRFGEVHDLSVILLACTIDNRWRNAKLEIALNRISHYCGIKHEGPMMPWGTPNSFNTFLFLDFYYYFHCSVF